MSKDLPYRPAVGIMLLNAENKVFVGQRLDTALEAWQMPQGGIDRGEDARTAALRELEEETGVLPDLVEIVAQAKRSLFYDLPEDLAGKVWGGKYRGQEQIWFLLRFLGRDEDVRIETAHPEFRAWRWASPAEVLDLIVPFKRALYAQILDEFAEQLGR
ncbi:RNA pyrophosphohydrolase [Sphingomonas jatrophae]|uniref:RNA pyrophosphohydrolase n=1 Tax=Sphingomonas jatrophae TaxID=1166337 RepID=A0A1I6M3I3_9SPHN|nr:RNA pyrophosphohydrolase [Sphingomonas jatrophae]SFS10229.1 putative (di)nucleoside polyphosphate hydrolase [Sphingomonas jatrophae]